MEHRKTLFPVVTSRPTPDLLQRWDRGGSSSARGPDLPLPHNLSLVPEEGRRGGPPGDISSKKKHKRLSHEQSTTPLKERAPTERHPQHTIEWPTFKGPKATMSLAPKHGIDELPLGPRDMQEIVCMRCGKYGHIVCIVEEVQNVPWLSQGTSTAVSPRDLTSDVKEERTEPVNSNVNVNANVNANAAEDGDIEMNLAYHLQGWFGSHKFNKEEAALRRYNARILESRRLHCCHCAGEHPLLM